MVALLRQNRFYYALVLVFLIVLTSVRIYIGKETTLYFVADYRYYWLDRSFFLITYLGEAISFFLAFIILLFFRYRYAFMIPVIGFISLGLAMLLKQVFALPRPMRYLKEHDLVEHFTFISELNISDNFMSFPSGHTAAAFTLFTFLALVFHRHKWLVTLSFLLAVLVGFSRVYFLHHFLEDIIFGSLIGTIISTFIFYWQMTYLKERKSWLERKLEVSRLLPKNEH